MMHKLFRLISRYLLLVMLAAAISPSFGWEAVPAMAEREHAMMAGMENHHVGHEISALQSDTADQADVACCADVQHQCCLSHQLSHPQGNSVSLLLPPSSAAVAMVSSERFLTRVPEGLERPPRSLSV